MNHPTLHYGTRSDGVAVDLGKLMVGGLLLQAGSGGGKSTAIRQLLEETHGRVQHLVIDPEGEFASLRESFPYIHAAPHGGDVIATPKTARLLCRRLVEIGASAVLDIYDLKVSEKREFVRLFLEELMSLPRSQWKSILVVIDEADVFAPQKAEASSTESVIDLNGRGRKRGYRLVLTTRRLSNLHKDAADLQNRMIGYTGLDLDVKRAGDELGFDKEKRLTLPQLQPGTFYVYGPAISATPTLVRTGATKTTHPQAGRLGATAPPAPAKVHAFLEQLANLPKEADEEARTMEDLRRLNADLTRKLKQAEKGGTVGVDRAEVERQVSAAVEKARAGWTRDFRRVLDRDIARLGKSIEGAHLLMEKALDAVTETVTPSFLALAGTFDSPADAPTAREPIASPERTRVSAPRPQREAAPNTAGDGSGGHLTGPEQRILDAVALFEAINPGEPVTRPQAAFVAKYATLSASSGGQAVGRLVDRGLLAIPATGRLLLTDAGRRLASAPAITSREELHAIALEQLGSDGERRILSHLLEVYPDVVHRKDVAAATGFSTLSASSGGQYVGKLVSLRFAEIPKTGYLTAGAILFPEGLR